MIREWGSHYFYIKMYGQFTKKNKIATRHTVGNSVQNQAHQNFLSHEAIIMDTDSGKFGNIIDRVSYC